MKEIPLYQIDAFATQVFAGNPAAVCPLEEWDVKLDLATLERLHPHGVVISAPGREVDFVSRYFAPGSGIPEDPVTGSIHCALAPYWARRLGKERMEARQVSKRGGAIGVELCGDRVHLSGSAVCYARGTLTI